MAISVYPSKVNLPLDAAGHKTVLSFLQQHFSAIGVDAWLQRVRAGRVHWQNGEVIDEYTAYRAQQWVYYYREVMQEPIIPFEETIIYQDEHILVADKPHFLPVMPNGAFVNENLQHRLRKKTGLDDLVAIHRLDRDTAGLVIFAHNAQTRGYYHQLFRDCLIQKTYLAVSETRHKAVVQDQHWQVKNHIAPAQPSFLSQVLVDKPANSHTEIRCVAVKEDKALFSLMPITGKTHQLRLHLNDLGWPIYHDRFYPELLPKQDDDFDSPLQLLAAELRFEDPISGSFQHFSSQQCLLFSG